jgi:hypothetical protein
LFPAPDSTVQLYINAIIASQKQAPPWLGRHYGYGFQQHNRAGACFYEITGQHATNPVAQSKTNTGTVRPRHHTRFHASRRLDRSWCRCFGCTCGDHEWGAFTELDDYQTSATADRIRLETEYDPSNATTTVDWSGLNTEANAGVAIEIAAAPPGDVFAEDVGILLGKPQDFRTPNVTVFA